jgi:hypothetical protein
MVQANRIDIITARQAPRGEELLKVAQRDSSRASELRRSEVWIFHAPFGNSSNSFEEPICPPRADLLAHRRRQCSHEVVDGRLQISATRV